MNEKLKELALQAGYEVDMFGVGHWDMPECKKFAELIVWECIVDFYRRYLDLNSNEDITVQVDRYVKEHFGVEE